MPAATPARDQTRHPPCSFCGSTRPPVSVGFRAMICAHCIHEIGASLQAIERGRQAAIADACVAGMECVFCQRILTTARFSVHRWIFGICDTCACSVAEFPIRYCGASPRGFGF